jgi:cell division septation protein DedD
VIAARRAVAARHEVRFGSRQLALFTGAFALVCALAFVLGLLVGRGLPSRIAGPAGGSGGGPREGGPGAGPEGRPAAALPDERLTFYKTLTAPTPEAPVVGPPVIEERLVPQEPPPAPAPRAPAPAARQAPVPDRRPGRGEPPAAAHAAPGGPGRDAGAAHPAPELARAPEPPVWTIQVSSFRSRALADELRARLATRGFDAYLVTAATEEGRVRYRVRVGSYASRGDAERVATDLRGERNLNPFVTTRTR